MTGTCYLGIDTSNYTTSAAICDAEGRVLANLKRPLPVKDGACGLRQSDAVFAHVQNLPSLMEELGARLSELREQGIRPVAVGVSAQPRAVEDSYMPCFRAGVAAAHALAAAEQLPVLRFAHQDGHVMAALSSAGMLSAVFDDEAGFKKPFAAFHVSGGTTEILLAEPVGGELRLEKIGGTQDLNAGQAIDRIGVAMNLTFPCGPAIERLARSYTGALPPLRVSVKGTVCNLSGLENLARDYLAECRDPAAVSAYVLAYLGKTLTTLSEGVRAAHPGIPIVYAGGVMSNSILQETLGAWGTKRGVSVGFAEPAFSADNAAGIALLCRSRVLRGAASLTE